MFKKRKKNRKGKGFNASTIEEVVDGRLIQRFIEANARFLIFCCVLIFFYIGNRYRNDDLLRRITIAQEEITRLRYKSITVSANLMSVSRPTQVEKIVKDKNLGLEFSKEPPKVLGED